MNKQRFAHELLKHYHKCKIIVAVLSGYVVLLQKAHNIEKQTFIRSNNNKCRTQ